MNHKFCKFPSIFHKISISDIEITSVICTRASWICAVVQWLLPTGIASPVGRVRMLCQLTELAAKCGVCSALDLGLEIFSRIYSKRNVKRIMLQ